MPILPQRRMAFIAAVLSITVLHAWMTRTDNTPTDKTQRHESTSVHTEIHYPTGAKYGDAPFSTTPPPAVDTTDSKTTQLRPATTKDTTVQAP